jgi:hypothetical protein
MIYLYKIVKYYLKLILFMREETYDVIVTAGGFSSNAINPNHITELLRCSIQCSTQRGLNTIRVPSSFSFF